MVAVVARGASVATNDIRGALEQVGVDVGMMVGQVVEHHLTGCHLVIATTPHSLITSVIIRYLSKSVVAGMVMDTEWVFSQDKLVQDHHLQGLWGDTRTTCRGLILDLTTTNSTTNALKLAEAAGLWKLAETRVIVLGRKSTQVKDVLLRRSLRNTLHALYLALHDPRHQYSSLRKIFTEDVCGALVSSDVWVYRRCMYCNNGEADVQVINHWVITPNINDIHELFQEQVQTLLGHKLRVVAVPHFPYMDFELNTRNPGGIVIQKDAIDTRLINTFSAALNFTFEIRAEPNLSWGLQENGVFTGMMGQLQREETDFSTIAGPSPERLKVVEFLRGYPSDPMTVISLKPSLLPENLSLIRPFTGELWLALLVSVGMWGMILWLLQLAWQRWVPDGSAVSFSTALLYGVGALLEQSPLEPSVHVSGRVLMGWWLVFCLVITNGYRSSLIAHMTIHGKTKLIETFDDLAKLKNWKWGTEPWLLQGVPLEYFSKHPDPVIQDIFKKMEKLSKEEALKKVLEGHYSLIFWENNLFITIASHYTDSHGNTPYFISKKGVSIMAAFGWGFRKGAPFYQRVHELMSRLEDAGFISYWHQEVIARRVRENRAAAALSPQIAVGDAGTDKSEVVLGMQHMQGAFYLLFLGSFIAILILVSLMDRRINTPALLAERARIAMFIIITHFLLSQAKMDTLIYHLVMMVIAPTLPTAVANQEAGGAVKQVGVDVGVILDQVVEHHLTGCHLVLITTPYSHITFYILRFLIESGNARIVVEAGSMFSKGQLPRDHHLQGLWGDTRTTCRGLIFDLTGTNSTSSVFGLAEAAGLWKLSRTRVVVVGGRAGVQDTLLHHSLRNTVHAVYLALHHSLLHTHFHPRNFHRHDGLYTNIFEKFL
nr:uncharacterized protein LOC128695307 [Cherax quadricarinatus]